MDGRCRLPLTAKIVSRQPVVLCSKNALQDPSSGAADRADKLKASNVRVIPCLSDERGLVDLFDAFRRSPHGVRQHVLT